MLSLGEFLNHVLPSEGFKCWVAIKKGNPTHQGLVNTNEELEATLRGIDSRQWNAFFACAAYKTPNNRKAENVLGAKAFWLDIDAGPGKPYADEDAAVEAVDRFAQTVGLPVPTILYSGNGVHCWWVLDRMLTPEEWKPAALRLKQLCEVHGLRADPSRTADIASILRGPQTFNWKDPVNPKPVTCEELQVVIPAAEFLAKLNGNVSPPGNNLAANILSGIGSEPPNMKQGYPDGQRTDAMMKRAGWCVGPWKMSEEDAVKAMLEWNTFNEPPKPEEEIKTAVRNSLRRELENNPPVQAAVIIPDEKPKLPYGFKWGRNMELMATTKDEDNNIVDIVVSPVPLYLAGIRRGENQSDISYQFHYWHPHRQWQEADIPAIEAHGSRCWGVYASEGINIQSHARKYFLTYLDRCIDMIKFKQDDQTRFEQFGWKDNFSAFFHGDTLLRNDGTRLRSQGEKEARKRAKMMAIPKNADAGQWRGASGSLFGDKMQPQEFTLLSGFGAPLMPLLASDEGGAILHMVSPDTGCGKSTVLEAIGSIWGEIDALNIVQRDSWVSKYRTLATLCNLPVIHDEIKYGDTDEVVAFLKSFTTGRDRNRGTRDGSVDHKKARWCTILITAANGSILDLLTESNGDMAQAARVFEITLPKIEKDRFVKGGRLEDILKANRAVVGRTYSEYLLIPGVMGWAEETIHKLFDHYHKVTGASVDHRFLLRLMAANATGGLLAKRAGLIELNPQRAIEWAVERVKERVNERFVFDAPRVLKNILNENIVDCLIVSDAYRPRTPVQVRKPATRALRIRYEIASQRLYISCDAIKKWIVATGRPYTSIVKDLEDQGILIHRGRLKSLGAGTDNMSVQVPCWEINMSHPMMNGELQLVEASQPIVLASK